ncbi:killer cell lectin-like receptor subfamily G member 2 [Tupaia chinensis]|uniref:killer cell lectin-like receptor subfamily G member 2 n=1 Tax=Tupaia chinensis TaxID=246437 RepID=UPI000FFBFC61|nr:killer cell lectin-like receptor subfamily G member 2 [Tupaia chinensis]
MRNPVLDHTARRVGPPKSLALRLVTVGRKGRVGDPQDWRPFPHYTVRTTRGGTFPQHGAPQSDRFWGSLSAGARCSSRVRVPCAGGAGTQRGRGRRTSATVNHSRDRGRDLKAAGPIRTRETKLSLYLGPGALRPASPGSSARGAGWAGKGAGEGLARAELTLEPVGSQGPELQQPQVPTEAEQPKSPESSPSLLQLEKEDAGLLLRAGVDGQKLPRAIALIGLPMYMKSLRWALVVMAVLLAVSAVTIVALASRTGTGCQLCPPGWLWSGEDCYYLSAEAQPGKHQICFLCASDYVCFTGAGHTSGHFPVFAIVDNAFRTWVYKWSLRAQFHLFGHLLGHFPVFAIVDNAFRTWVYKWSLRAQFHLFGHLLGHVDFLSRHPVTTYSWVGAQRGPQGWHWIDGTPLLPQLLPKDHQDNPDLHCGGLKEGKLVALNCSSPRPWVCVTEAG